MNSSRNAGDPIHRGQHQSGRIHLRNNQGGGSFKLSENISSSVNPPAQLGKKRKHGTRRSQGWPRQQPQQVQAGQKPKQRKQQRTQQQGFNPQRRCPAPTHLRSVLSSPKPERGSAERHRVKKQTPNPLLPMHQGHSGSRSRKEFAHLRTVSTDNSRGRPSFRCYLPLLFRCRSRLHEGLLIFRLPLRLHLSSSP